MKQVPVFGDPLWIAAAKAPDFGGRGGRSPGQPWADLRGPGPKGRTCASCKHLRSVKKTKRFYKCGLVPITNGPGTDIRLKDPACLLYEPALTEGSGPAKLT